MMHSPTCALLLFVVLPAVCLRLTTLQSGVDTTSQLSVHVRFVNKETSSDRSQCMVVQLSRLASELAKFHIALTYRRYPAISMKGCDSVSACFLTHPECFPSGAVNSKGLGHHDVDLNSFSLPGVIGDWCSHLQLVQELAENPLPNIDYYLLLEDDVVFTPDAAESLSDLLRASRRHWALVAFDTYEGLSSKPLLTGNKTHVNRAVEGLPLYSLSHERSYFGSHAWLLDSLHLRRFKNFLEETPTEALDWVPLRTRPQHYGFMAYMPGVLLQAHMLHGENPRILKQCTHLENSVIEDVAAIQEQEVGVAAAIHRQDTVTENSSPDRNFEEVVILGMPHSGTRLLLSLFNENYKTAQFCKSANGAGCGGVWTHTHPGRIAELGDDTVGRFQKALALIVVRHPLSTIRAIQEHKMAEIDCGHAGPTARCRYHAEEAARFTELPSAACEHADGVNCWPNIFRGWQSYIEGYKALETSDQFKGVLFLRYEDLVEEPTMALKLISSRLGHPALMKFTTVNTSKMDDPQRWNGFDFGRQLSRQMTDWCLEAKEGHHLAWEFGYTMCQSHHKEKYDFSRTFRVVGNRVSYADQHPPTSRFAVARGTLSATIATTSHWPLSKS
uniref:Sulfotransferase domain-containing protein n=1 Tax=Noctiluca scintillans TaxID=2966 RepID=A0A7S1AM43_NOCSC|mmetsp:Transcript_51723/g.138012  ORF Transcript_51723/g.138012 Transcript_51723/m.138012 type:complete len:615 (+) Transcript_51723:57-1901(+)